MSTTETYPPLSSVLESRERTETGGEFLQGRIEEAVSECEIEPTTEVREALSGYYTDHYGLADMINGVLEGSVTDEQLDKALEGDRGVIPKQNFDRMLEGYDYLAFPNIPSAESATRLLAFAQRQERQATTEEARKHLHDLLLRCTSRAISSVLFQEKSLSITTVGEEELQVVRGLYNKLADNLAGSTGQVDSHRAIRWPVNNGASEFSVRLDYVEAGIIDAKEKFWDDARHAGQLEFHNTGYLGGISLTGNLMSRTEQMRRKGTMNAQTAVWDQMHSVVPHFSERYDPKTYKNNADKTNNETASGTVALALGDIIEVAPFARDAHYAVVFPRTAEVLDRVPLPTEKGTTNISFGQPDVEGPDGGDRVFFAAPRQDEGQIQPDAYAIPLRRTATLIFTGGTEISKSDSFGLGEGFPDRLHITETDDPEELIKQLQRNYVSRPEYAGRLVVPLRRGIFNFVPENMPIQNASYREGPRYNANPLLAS